MKGLKGLQCLADPPLAADPARPRAPVTQAAPEAANREPAMPPRSLRTAALSFGLVTIPVRFYTAPSSQSPHFHLIHEQCGSRIKQQLFCPTCGRVVERNELVRGYEVQGHSELDGQYVLFTDEELRALETAASPALEALVR